MRRSPACHLACALAFALAFACALAPHSAWAYFNQVDDKNSAQQDIGSYGQPLAAADIPEGTYVCDVRTSSRMCVFYNTATDAATRSDNKELCTITVSGGSIVASFYLSPAYTHLYMGTGAQAAKLTDKTGTDDSAYVKGVAYPVSTSSGTSNAYYYTMAVPALNTPVTFASFDGGSVGVEEGKWFNRQVVFMPGDEVNAAIEAAKDPEEKTSKKKRDGGSGSGDGADDVQERASSQPQVVYVYVDEPEQATTGTATGAGQAREKGDAEASRSSVGTRRGVAISPVQVDVQADAPGEGAELAAASEEGQGLSQAAVLGAVVAVLALLGCLARVIMFGCGKAGRP